jgi:hypothetical protein
VSPCRDGDGLPVEVEISPQILCRGREFPGRLEEDEGDSYSRTAEEIKQLRTRGARLGAEARAFGAQSRDWVP